MLELLLYALVVGLIVGAVARLLMPGPDPIGFLGTAGIGVGGAFLGTFIGRLIFGEGQYVAGFIMAVIGAMIILALVRSSRRRRFVRY